MAKKKHYDICKCPECGKACLSEHDLKIHLKTHDSSDFDKKRGNSSRQGARKGPGWDDD